MTINDGFISGTTVVVNHGSPSESWNLIILGDGYKQNELGKYSTDVQNIITGIQSNRPFKSVWSGINIYRVDVVSTDSGADDPTVCGGTGAMANTYFDAAFCSGGNVRRALTVNNSTVISVANQQVPQWNMIIVLINSNIYGGTGGYIAVCSTATSASEIAIHEMGHTAFGLADEYETYSGCSSGEIGHDVYNGVEPSQPDITINTDRTTIKWNNLISPSTEIPTSRNSNCSICDPQPNPILPGYCWSI